ncbi:hypothetical protein JOB18_043113 [Solea senegalensis]|uniref:Uncharacterized protein n=1 Tax=Solea senegalensis TaxID=28829 RepID=A0AAV6Q4E5_SOLSE|nr:hypothetical protein JOB18_043113 [Solea senegalensis]
MQQLDHHSTQLMTIFKRKGGAAGRKLRNIMVDLDKNEAVETRKACVLKALMVYLNEDPENRIREYMWKAGVDLTLPPPDTFTFFSSEEFAGLGIIYGWCYILLDKTKCSL